MGVALKKDSIDLGIVVADAEKALAFYRDTLGLEFFASTPLGNGTGVMHRLMCGTTMIKLVDPGKEIPARAPQGGTQGATGFRYFTISVTNLDEITATCESAGYKVATQPREIRPGVRISMVEDPEGNIVEFIEQ